MRAELVFVDIIVNIIIIAITSIGIEAYNTKENEKFKKEKMSNFTFLVLVLVYAIFRFLIVTLGLIYVNYGKSLLKF